MLEIAGGIVLAFFFLLWILSPAEEIDTLPLRPRYLMTIWVPRIIVFLTVTVLIIALIKLI